MQTRFTLKLIAGVMLAGFVSAHAALVSRVTSFTDGSVLFASDLNSEFNNLVNGINSIDNDNIAAGANIAPSKISATIAGDGISRDGTTGALAVNPDGSTLEISGDSVRVKDAGITLAKHANLAALSVMGNATNASAAVTAITAATDGHILRRSGTSIGFGALGADTVNTTQIVNSAVTSAKIADTTIATGDIADGAITQAKRASLGQQVSSSSGTFNTSSASYVDATNLSVSITTTGRPVWVGLIADGSASAALMTCAGSGAVTEALCRVKIMRDSTDISINYLYTRAEPNGDFPQELQVGVPPSSIQFIDVPSAGTYTYKIRGLAESTSTTLLLQRAKLVAFEL